MLIKESISVAQSSVSIEGGTITNSSANYEGGVFYMDNQGLNLTVAGTVI